MMMMMMMTRSTTLKQCHSSSSCRRRICTIQGCYRPLPPLRLRRRLGGVIVPLATADRFFQNRSGGGTAVLLVLPVVPSSSSAALFATSTNIDPSSMNHHHHVPPPPPPVVVAAAAAAQTQIAELSQQSSPSSTVVLRYPIIPKNDKGKLLEYSVIHTDRSLNVMSQPFQTIMNDLYTCFNTTYSAYHTVIIPGSGTFGMESVVRQFVAPITTTDSNSNSSGSSHNQNHNQQQQQRKQRLPMVLRNGWFSYRWTEILDMMHGTSDGSSGATFLGGNSSSDSSSTTGSTTTHNHNNTTTTTHNVLSAQPLENTTNQPQYQPMPIDDVVRYIYQERPSIFFCPHVETSTGILLPDSYIQQIATAMHTIQGLLVVDCIASGCVWLDMKSLGIDILITAPQKGWSGPPCAAFVCMSELAVSTMHEQSSAAATNRIAETSFSLSLKRWSAVMDAYVRPKPGGAGFAYHTTMPTDALRDFHQVTVETLDIGIDILKQQQIQLGYEVRSLLTNKYGLRSVAASQSLYGAPGVVVFFSPGSNTVDNPIMMKLFQSIDTDDDGISSGSNSNEHQQQQQQPIQIAMGVPWKLQYEPTNCKTFRMGLFGIDKLLNIESTVQTIDTSMERVVRRLSPSSPN